MAVVDTVSMVRDDGEFDGYRDGSVVFPDDEADET